MLSGYALMSFIILIILCSQKFIRNRYYEFFLIMHIFNTIMILVAALFHECGSVFIGFGFVWFDYLLRFIIVRKYKKDR